MISYILGFENWLLEDPQRVESFRCTTLVVGVIIMLILAIAYLWLQNRKKDRQILIMKRMIRSYSIHYGVWKQ